MWAKHFLPCHVVEGVDEAKVFVLGFPVGGWRGRVSMGGVDGGCWVCVFLSSGFLEWDSGLGCSCFRFPSSVPGCVQVCAGRVGVDASSFANCADFCACLIGGGEVGDWSWSR